MLRRRRHRLRNNTDRTIYLREAVTGKGYYSHETRLDPNSMREDFQATLYQERSREFGLPSEIVIFVGENEALRGLIPEMFINYTELSFEMDEANYKLIVYGIPAQLTDRFPFRGTSYSGRPRDIVRSCGFKAIDTKNEGPLILDDKTARIAAILESRMRWGGIGGSTFASIAEARARVDELTQDNKALRSRLSSLEEQVSYLMAIVTRQPIQK